MGHLNALRRPVMTCPACGIPVEAIFTLDLKDTGYVPEGTMTKKLTLDATVVGMELHHDCRAQTPRTGPGIGRGLGNIPRAFQAPNSGSLGIETDPGPEPDEGPERPVVSHSGEQDPLSAALDQDAAPRCGETHLWSDGARHYETRCTLAPGHAVASSGGGHIDSRGRTW